MDLVVNGTPWRLESAKGTAACHQTAKEPASSSGGTPSAQPVSGVVRDSEVTVPVLRECVNTDPDRPLLWVLRNELDLTGTKYGCGEGECGACTVLVNGEAQRSCITPLHAVAGKRITTIEGLGKHGNPHPLQVAFAECDAMQCGYCTSGMILSAAALLHKKGSPSESEVKEAMQGNICRCGTYNRILAAIQKAAGVISASAKAGRDA